MTLREELEKLSNFDLEHEIFEKLKKEFRSLAKDTHNGGCILSFRDIDTKIVNNIIEKLKNEEISVYDNIIIDNVVQTDVFLLVWNRIVFEGKILKAPYPCEKCNDKSRFSCMGCKKYAEYLNLAHAKTYIRNDIPGINVAIKHDEVCVE